MTHTLTGIAKTLLIPLMARAVESQNDTPLFKDNMSLQTLDKVSNELDLPPYPSPLVQFGISARTQRFDTQLRRFIATYPQAVIVNLGCGLDTRFYRVDNGQINWYDLDIPSVIQLRQRLFPQQPRCHLIASSVISTDFTPIIQAQAPTLFIAEGLLMYLPLQAVKQLFYRISQCCPQAQILFEAMSPLAAFVNNYNPEFRHYHAKFKWGIHKAIQLHSWQPNLRLIHEWHYFDSHAAHQPFKVKFLLTFAAFRHSMKIIQVDFAKNE